MSMLILNRTLEDRFEANLRYRADQRLLTILQEAGLPRGALARAWFDASAFSVPFMDALCGGGYIEEELIVEVLAARFGLAVAHPDTSFAASGVPWDMAVRAGAIRLTDGSLAIMPRGRSLPDLLQSLETPYIGSPVALVTRQNLIAIALQDKQRVVQDATYGLATLTPELSAAQLLNRTQIGIIFLALFGLGTAWALFPRPAFAAAHFLGFAVFFSLAWLRLLAFLAPPVPEEKAHYLREHELPIYTILVPLFEEKAALQGLLTALESLDYPRMKLDVKLLVEEEDEITQEALRDIRVPGWVDIVLIPKGRVRTKPRALNVGLALARGAYLVVYDAEDRPDPLQLRHALDRFETSARRTAVVQACLTIDRSQRSFLANQFRLEYAGLFAVVLPAFAKLGLPLPLGGTSNHFRTAILHAIGGWDAFNVTEDADIGLRLHRFGYRAAVIASKTEEEAPETLQAWIKQRTRWFKGWIITILVHSRRPRQLVKDCRPFGATMFILSTVGIVLAALAEPICLIFLGISIARGEFLRSTPFFWDAFLQASFLVSLVAGHVAAALTYLKGARRIDFKPSILSVLAIPFYWLLISVAAFRGCWKAFTEPYHWEKTAHILERVPLADGCEPQETLQRRPPVSSIL